LTAHWDAFFGTIAARYDLTQEQLESQFQKKRGPIAHDGSS